MNKAIVTILLVSLFFVNGTISISNSDTPEPETLNDAVRVTIVKLNATIDAVRGTVEVKKVNSTEWIPATKGMIIQEGDKISTGFRSKCALTFGNNSVFIVKSLTQMTVNRFLKDGDTILTRIKLRIGCIRLKVKPDQPVKTDMKISIPNAVCSVRGTTFGVYLDDNNTTIVEAFDGEVLVNNTSTGEWTTIEGWGNGTGYRATVENGTSMFVELAYLGPLYLWDFDWWIPVPTIGSGGYGDRKPTHT